MTSIKPTKGPTTTGVTDVAPSSATSKPREALGAELDAARSKKADGAQATEGTWAAVVKDLKSGKISADQVIEQLADKQLQSPTAKMLPPVERAKLEAALRDALANDPAIAALLSDAGLSR